MIFMIVNLISFTLVPNNHPAVGFVSSPLPILSSPLILLHSLQCRFFSHTSPRSSWNIYSKLEPELLSS